MQPLSGDPQRMKFALEVSGIGIWGMELHTNKIEWDERCSHLFGLSPVSELSFDQLIGHIYSDDREKVTDAFRVARTAAHGKLSGVQFRVIQPGGNLRWLYFKGQALQHDNRVLQICGIAEDLTEIIGGLQVTTEATELAKLALDGSGAGSFRVFLETDSMQYSPAFARIITGKEDLVFTRADFIEYIYPEDRPVRDAACRKAAETGTLAYKARVVWDDGSIHWVHTAGTYLSDNSGKKYLFAGTVRDITDEVTQQLALLAAEARFRDVIEQAPLGIGLLRGRNMIIELGNDRIFRLWGKHASITGMPLTEAIPEPEGQPFMALLESVYDSGIPCSRSNILARLEHNGKPEDQYFDFSYAPLRDHHGQVNGVMVLATEVTAQVKARKELEESESRLNSLVENTPDVITRWDKGLRLLYANGSFAAKTGAPLSMLLGRTNLEMGQPESIAVPYMEALQRTFDSGVLQEHSNNFPTPFDTVFYHSRLVPEKGEYGQVKSVLAIARDVTELKRSEERLRAIIAAAPAGIGLFVGRDLVIEYPNQTFIDIVGKGPGVEGLPLREAMPELVTEGQPFLKILDDVFTTGNMFQSFESLVKIVRNGVMTYNYYNITYTPVFDEGGKVYAILDIAIDVTEQVKAAEERDKTRQTLELAMKIGGLGNFDIDLQTGMATYSKPIAGWFGMNGPQPISSIFARVYNEDRQQVTDMIEASVTGINNGKHDLVYRVENSLSGELHYLHSMGQVQVQDGSPVNIAGIIQNVTAETLAARKLEASENRLRSLVESAPFPIGVLVGHEMRILLANQSILNSWGKGNEVIGKLFREVLPELESQQVFEQLERVLATGLPFSIRNQQLEMVMDGKPTTFYFNYNFTPLFDDGGSAYGVLSTASDVTDLVRAKQRSENAETVLNSAIELAELGTWSLDVATGLLSISPRVQRWFGLPFNQADQHEAYRQIHEKDRQRILMATLRALAGSGNGLYNEEYTVVTRGTGAERIVHALGRTTFDTSGKASRLTGTLQEVTLHRQLQLALENQVKERTEELAASNEELRLANNELALSNQLLKSSNDELGQYAYVASHDLQEPLRKIRMFASRLSQHRSLPEEPAALVVKIDGSAQRMSMLIHDLLEFSSLQKSNKLVRPVNLAEVISHVISDFELLIEEKNVVIRTGNLPEIQAVLLQMNQLFYNLLSNAMKFSNAATTPVIEISSKPIRSEEVKKHIAHPYSFAQYHHITVADNGIGFENRYSEQIFQVFKRLHGREAYPGSGIGLAMCRRIAENHNGILYADSIPDEGSVFHILLPDRQQEQEAPLPPDFRWINE